MNILVTGAAGFIAYHLISHLVKDGHRVFGIDNFNSSYYDKQLKYDRATELSVNKTFQIMDFDLNNIDISETHYEYPDLIIHLGAFAAVRASMEQPDQCVRDNISGTQRIIEFAELNDIPVIYASTSCVSAGNKLPWKESQPTKWQMNPYGYTKHVNECQFKASKLSRKIGLRFFTAYGEWGRPDMALHIFTKNIIDKKPIKVYNYGNMKRDFTYVGDIIQGIKLVIAKIMKSKKIDEIYNIGNGKQVNLMDFVHELEKKLDTKAIIQYEPKHPADTLETWSDTTKLQKLGYKSTTSIEEGMDKFIHWYRNYYK